MNKNTSDNEKFRSLYVCIFCLILIFSIIFTILIYYFVRHKKRYYFDAAGRKFIASSDNYTNIIYQLLEIIQFDYQDLLKKKVQDCSVGILHIRNDSNQNLLHLCAINGSHECMSYILEFERILNPNEIDDYEKVPLYYCVKLHSDETEINQDMFLKLVKITNIDILCDGVKLKDLFNEWQNRLYDTYNKAITIKT